VLVVRSEAVALAVAGMAEIAYVSILVFLNVSAVYVFSFGASVAVILFLGITFLPKYTIRTMRAEPHAALAYLANRLRLAGYRVAESSGNLTVRIGSFSAVLVSARRTETGCRVRYQPYATPSGWGTLMVLTLITYTALAGFALAAYGFLRATFFVRSKVLPLLPEDGGIPEIPAADLTRVILLEALAEAHRTAAEAEEAVRSSYHDSLAIVFFGAMLAWFALFVAFSFQLDPDFFARFGRAALLATAFVAGAALPTAWLIRHRMAPRLTRYRDWVGRFRAAMERAASAKSTEEPEPSSFEFLMESAAEVPAWIDLVRRKGVNRDPATALLLLMVVIWTFTLGSTALSFVFFDAVLAGVFGIAGIVLGIGAVLFYRRWRRRWDAETEQAHRDWTRRVQGVRVRMEQYLRDL